jgi:hypothetical protein
MDVKLVYGSKTVLSNGQLARRRTKSVIKINSGEFIIS